MSDLPVSVRTVTKGQKQKLGALNIRIHPVVKKALEMAADRAHETVTDFVVKSALERAKRYGVTDEDAAAQLAAEGTVYEVWRR